MCVNLCYKLSTFQALGKVKLPSSCQACVFIYSSRGRWVFPPLLCSFPPTATFRSFPAPDYWVVLLLLPAALFVYSSHGKWVFPLFLWSFLPLPLSQAFLLLVAGRAPPLRQRLSGPPSLFIYSPEKDSLPPIFGSGRPTLFPACLYCSYFLLVSFSCSPGWRSVCPGGYAALAQACLWEYRGTAKLTWSASSQAISSPVTGGLGASLFLGLTWSGDSLRRLEVWRGQSYASSQWLCLQNVSLASLQDFTIGGSLSASSL
jgi:hypothetical protein